MNAGAHKRPAPRIAAPALVWQRNYWRPCADGKGPVGEDRDAEEAWFLAIDQVLLHLFLFLCPGAEAKFVCPNFEGDHRGIYHSQSLYLFRHKANLAPGMLEKSLTPLEDSERSARHDVFTIQTQHAGVRLVLHARLHAEYLTLLFAADFSDWPETSKIDSSIAKVWDEFLKLHDIVIRRSREAKHPNFDNPLSPEDALLIDGHSIETNLKSWVDEICIRAFGGRAADHGPSLDKCGGVFGDFFGYIFGLRSESHKPPAPANGRLEPTSFSQTSGKRLRIPAVVDGSLFRKGALELLDAIWPIVRGFNAGSKDLERRYGKPEYSVSLFQRGSVLYISSLGRLMPNNPRREPVVYALVVSYGSRWRLGRLIDRIHSLGTLRLAALRDLTKINTASRNITALSGSLPERLKSGQIPAEGHREAFARIGGDIDYGLFYRVARSRYYVASFKELLEMMQTERIDGFQPYNDFVRRRVYDAFDYIDRVGARYEELRRSISFWIAADQQRAMQSLQEATAEHTKATARQTTVTALQTQVTNHLLRAAELFSIFPVTYYFGMATHDTVPEVAAHSKWLTYVVPTTTWPYFSVGFCIAVGLATYSHWARTSRSPKT
jgi:hypothetical protein